MTFSFRGAKSKYERNIFGALLELKQNCFDACMDYNAIVFHAEVVGKESIIAKGFGQRGKGKGNVCGLFIQRTAMVYPTSPIIPNLPYDCLLLYQRVGYDQ